jgi:uncharacterized membrane protein
MKRFGEFLKTTALGGFLVLLPLLLLYLLLGQMLGLVIVIATPLADLFPAGTFDRLPFHEIIAFGLITGASFLIGIFMRIAYARRLGQWAENTVLQRMPMYSLLKTVTSSLTENEDDDGFIPAIMTLPTGNQVLVAIVEDRGGELLTVFQPSCPTPTVGTLQLVKRDRVRKLDVKLLDVTKVLSEWGVGMQALLNEKNHEKSIDSEGEQE